MEVYAIEKNWKIGRPRVVPQVNNDSRLLINRLLSWTLHNSNLVALHNMNNVWRDIWGSRRQNQHFGTFPVFIAIWKFGNLSRNSLKIEGSATYCCHWPPRMMVKVDSLPICYPMLVRAFFLHTRIAPSDSGSDWPNNLRSTESSPFATRLPLDCLIQFRRRRRNDLWLYNMFRSDYIKKLHPAIWGPSFVWG